MSAEKDPSAKSDETEKVGTGPLLLSILAYTGARLVLVVVVAALIMGVGALVDVQIPLFVAAIFGVLIALPLGMVLFKSLRLRVNRQISAVEGDRRRRQDDLQSRLRGDKSK